MHSRRVRRRADTLSVEHISVVSGRAQNMLGGASRATGDTAPTHIRERSAAWIVRLELQVRCTSLHPGTSNAMSGRRTRGERSTARGLHSPDIPWFSMISSWTVHGSRQFSPRTLIGISVTPLGLGGGKGEHYWAECTLRAVELLESINCGGGAVGGREVGVIGMSSERAGNRSELCRR